MDAGDAAFVDEDYAAALAHYNDAFKATGAASATAIMHSHRSAALHKLGRFVDSLDDANAAVRLARASNDTAAECIAQYRKGLASFALEEFETAQSAFAKAKQLASARPDLLRSLETWLRKCGAEIDAEDADADSDSEAPAPSVGATAAGSAGAGAVAAPVPQKTYDWYQSATHVTVTIMAKGAVEAASRVGISATEVDVAVVLESGGEVAATLALYDAVVPAESTVVYRPTKVELKLRKASALQWPQLQRPAAAAAAPAAVAVAAAGGAPAAKPAYPTSSLKPKNWEAIDKDITKAEEEEKPEGEEALQKLFRQIYGNASEDTRRAMVKSFQTSGGTVLSTNWDEVSKADYERDRQAPDGMHWKKWE